MAILTYIVIAATLVFLTIQIKRQRVSLGTVVWPYLLLLILGIVMYPPLLRKLTQIFGFVNTENFVFFLICGYLFILMVVHEIRIARMNDQIRELSRELALTNKEQSEECNKNAK